MMSSSLLLLLVLGQSPSDDPIDLVQRLGAPRFADREQAKSALERLGRHALPALRKARDEKDPEVRSSAGVLINRIEGLLLTQPTNVSLDFQDVSILDAVKTLGDQAGIRLSLLPDNSPSWRSRKVTIREKGPLPFWKALDRFCDAGHLQYNVGMHNFNNGRDKEPSFPLFEGGGRAILPTSDSGPFRVSIVQLHFQRDVTFSNAGPMTPRPSARLAVPLEGPKPVPQIAEHLNVQLQVAGEPRLTLSQSGPLRVTEAIDDRGQPLTLPATGGGVTHRVSGYFGMAGGSVIQLQAPLNRPIQPGSTIKSLKGVIPVLVAMRKPDPLVVTLAGSAGRTFQNDDAALTVHEVRPPQGNNQPGSVEVTIRPNVLNASAGAGQHNDSGSLRPDSYQHQIEMLDGEGRLIAWFQTSYDVETGRMTMTIPQPEQANAAAMIRYFGLVRSTTEVPFAFSDLPLP